MYPLQVRDVEEFGVVSQSLTAWFDPEGFDRAPEERFIKAVNDRMALTKSKDVFVYVHGYKVNFENPLLVAADLQRPAAVDQLQTLGRQLGLAVHAEGTDARDDDWEARLLFEAWTDTEYGPLAGWLATGERGMDVHSWDRQPPAPEGIRGGDVVVQDVPRIQEPRIR